MEEEAEVAGSSVHVTAHNLRVANALLSFTTLALGLGIDVRVAGQIPATMKNFLAQELVSRGQQWRGGVASYR